MKRFESTAIAVVCLLLALLFLYLSGYALTFTSVISEKGYLSERIVEERDNILLGLVWLITGLALLWMFGRVEKHLPLKTVVIITLGWVLAAGVFWVLAAQTEPRADAAYIASAARRVAKGNYAELKRASGYLNRHPYQLGFMMLSECLQLLFGAGNNLTMQIVNAVMLTAACAAVLYITWNSTKSPRVVRYTALLLALCIQPILYCTFLYGNLYSIACVLWAAGYVLRVMRGGRLWLFAPAALLCGLSVLFKPNGWIPTLALMIVCGLWLLSTRRYKALPLVLTLALGPMLITNAVTGIYQLRSGADLSKGVPMTAYLAMGLQESSRAEGWYNEYVDNVYKSSNYDPARASARAIRNIQSRLREFGDDPAYAAQFFHGKMVSQWNETTMEAIWISRTCKYAATRWPFATSVLRGGLRQPFEDYMEAYNTLLYLCFAAGLALFSIRLFKRKACDWPDDFMLAFFGIAVFGAFVYHMLFEAKSQYLFVYLLLMIPVAASALARLPLSLRRVRKKKDFMPPLS